MSIRNTPFVSGEYYHLYNRGNSKQTIFHDKEDYYRFTNLLYTCNGTNNFRDFLVKNTTEKDPYLFERGKQIVSIGAYVLMSNHFHILITEKEENGISKFMQKLSTGYVMYYNKKYKRTGSLFEGKFKSKHLDSDKYLKYIFSYIHLNPVKLIQKDWKEKGIRNKKDVLDYLDSYMFCSFIDYKGKERKQNLILDYDSFPKYFPSQKMFNQEIFDWLLFGKNLLGKT
jgi:putative transposase